MPDHGKIRIGDKYQATMIPACNAAFDYSDSAKYIEYPREPPILESYQWYPQDVSLMVGCLVNVKHFGYGIAVDTNEDDLQVEFAGKYDDRIERIYKTDLLELHYYDKIFKFENGKHVSTKFLEHDPCVPFWRGWHGIICDFKNGQEVRRELTKDHTHSNIIYYFENSEFGARLVRLEYTKDHMLHGLVRYFDETNNSRVEYAKGHPQHGEIRYFENDNTHNLWDGRIGFNGKHVRTEYAKGHPQHGEIRFFENAILTKIIVDGRDYTSGEKRKIQEVYVLD